MIKIQEIKKICQKNMLPLLCAHRGGKQTTPENTLAAFSNALKNKCPCIELDIQFTSDKKIIVIHDETLNRTTNGSGNVHEQSLKDLQKFDAGSWYNSNFQDEILPSLEDVLDLVQDKSLLLIEIKKYLHPSKELEQELLRLLNKYKLTHDCVLHSFDKGSLERLNKLDPTLNLGFLYEELPINKPSYVKGLHPSKKILKDLNAAEKALNWIASWTFKSIEDYKVIKKESLPDILIADPIEDFCKEFNII